MGVVRNPEIVADNLSGIPTRDYEEPIPFQLHRVEIVSVTAVFQNSFSEILSFAKAFGHKKTVKIYVGRNLAI